MSWTCWPHCATASPSSRTGLWPRSCGWTSRVRRPPWAASCSGCAPPPQRRSAAMHEQFDQLAALLPELWTALGQTLTMLGIGLVAAVLLGGPLGILLFLVSPGQSLANRWLAAPLGWFVSTVRSLPFIVLLVALV